MEGGDRVQLITLYTRVLLHLAENPRISQETLARRMDVTMRTVQRHLTELEEEGYLRVDRDKKPFEYSVDWTKSCPYIEWLRVIVFHPEVRGALRALSDAATQTYERALIERRDNRESLHELFAAMAKEPVISR